MVCMCSLVQCEHQVALIVFWDIEAYGRCLVWDSCSMGQVVETDEMTHIRFFPKFSYLLTQYKTTLRPFSISCLSCTVLVSTTAWSVSICILYVLTQVMLMGR